MMKLEQVLAYLHQKYDNAEIFEECSDEFSPYDAESSITLLEYKSRRADYPEIMIEGLKIQKIYEFQTKKARNLSMLVNLKEKFVLGT